MQDQFLSPSSLSSNAAPGSQPRQLLQPPVPSGQRAVTSIYRTKIAGHCRLITITWSRNLFANGLSVSVEGSSEGNEPGSDRCRVELWPWHFWRRQGSKALHVQGTVVGVHWDLRGAKFRSGNPEPQSGYYVAVVSADEVVLLLGDLKKEAFRQAGARSSSIEAAAVSKEEHVIGKQRFTTRSRFHDQGKLHDISIECNTPAPTDGGAGPVNLDAEMSIKIDGQAATHVKHLQWKFRGNTTVPVGTVNVEVYWDVHGWLFEPAVRHALFIFKPAPAPSSPSAELEADGAGVSNAAGGSADFSLYLHAWKVD